MISGELYIVFMLGFFSDSTICMFWPILRESVLWMLLMGVESTDSATKSYLIHKMKISTGSKFEVSASLLSFGMKGGVSFRLIRDSQSKLLKNNYCLISLAPPLDPRRWAGYFWSNPSISVLIVKICIRTLNLCWAWLSLMVGGARSCRINPVLHKYSWRVALRLPFHRWSRQVSTSHRAYRGTSSKWLREQCIREFHRQSWPHRSLWFWWEITRNRLTWCSRPYRLVHFQV